MEQPDRLSELPDELLHHILHLTPCREAESTAILSRRWRGLWPPPTSTSINIQIPSPENTHITSSHGSIERLSINVAEYCNSHVSAVRDVLSHPSSQGVQDLRIRAQLSTDRLREIALNDYNDTCSWMPSWYAGEFELSNISVPSAALRVLQLTNCRYLTVTPTAAAPATSTCSLPCLEVLRLRRCNVDLQRLQNMVLASPNLAVLQLEYVRLSTGRRNNGDDDGYYSGRRSEELTQSLCCPGIRTLVLLNCFREKEDATAIELNVPRVQHFRYRGGINQFTLRSPLPDVRRAYLHILASYRSEDVEMCECFWSFVKNFSGAKDLKLKLEWPINNVAALDRSRISDLLLGKNETSQWIMFCVEQLEIDAPYYRRSNNDVGVAIGNLLQCCPALRDLRLKLNAANQRRTRRKRKGQLDFHKSIDNFRRRSDHPVAPLYGENAKFEVSDIPGMSNRWIHFGCLRSHLRRLSLQFQMDKDDPSCIGMRLINFFVKRGTALEEIYIHDGNLKMWEHVNCKISGYAANPQPFSEDQVLVRISQALSMNQFSSSSKISVWAHPHKLEVRRTNPWVGSRNFTIIPLADR